MTDILTALDQKKFMGLIPEREAMIAGGSTEPLPDKYPVNALAEALHPVRQHLKVSEIRMMTEDAASVTLVPDTDGGTSACAYFQPGDYLSFPMRLGNIMTARPYSIASSPEDALDGFYRIIVKRVPGGKVSNYIIDNWKPGAKVVSSGPVSGLAYSPLRDAKTVIGVVGGSAISSFMSMAKAIAEGGADFDLTLLYGSRTCAGIIGKAELDELAARCDKLKVVYILSDEEVDGFEHGFISAELIKKYAPEGEPYSLFVSGPPMMTDFIKSELIKLGLERKYVRFGLDGDVYDGKIFPDYPAHAPASVKITAHVRDVTKSVVGSPAETVLHILENGGIAVPTHCRSGSCGYCHTKLVSGEVFVPEKDDFRREADIEYGYIHPCRTFPMSDLELIVPWVR